MWDLPYECCNARPIGLGEGLLGVVFGECGVYWRSKAWFIAVYNQFIHCFPTGQVRLSLFPRQLQHIRGRPRGLDRLEQLDVTGGSLSWKLPRIHADRTTSTGYFQRAESSATAPYSLLTLIFKRQETPRGCLYLWSPSFGQCSKAPWPHVRGSEPRSDHAPSSP